MTDWKKVNLYIGIPTRRGIVPETAWALETASGELHALGAEVRKHANRLPEMDMARGNIFWEFLQSKATHLLQHDDDVSAPAHVYRRLIEADFPIVAAPYRLKSMKIHQMVVFYRGKHLEQEPVRGTVAVQRIGGGFVLYTRAAVQKLADDHGIWTWGGQSGVRGLTCCMHYVDETGEYLTEDYATCERWIEEGGEVRALLDAPTVHVDGPIQMQGDFGKLWPKRLTHSVEPAPGLYTIAARDENRSFFTNAQPPGPT